MYTGNFILHNYPLGVLGVWSSVFLDTGMIVIYIMCFLIIVQLIIIFLMGKMKPTDNSVLTKEIIREILATNFHQNLGSGSELMKRLSEGLFQGNNQNESVPRLVDIKSSINDIENRIEQLNVVLTNLSNNNSSLNPEAKKTSEDSDRNLISAINNMGLEVKELSRLYNQLDQKITMLAKQKPAGSDKETPII